ncbi:MAG: 2Fe-2S iron-sulfur cluster binding domain-containing protein, partial [Proteobacteria bacterium]|nr:2Fe-2S iron-sulfur cluster binding domain-containing protein [Pseudomonadota bacterium]
RGPLAGLYFANAWARIGGGYMPCIFSGLLASKEAMADMESGGDPALIVDMGARMADQVQNAREPQDLDALLAGGMISALHPARLDLKVREIIRETPSTKTLRLIPLQGDPPPFRAGQYLNLSVRIDGSKTSRAYSISSPPGAPFLDVTVRRKENGFVSPYLLDRIEPGRVLESTGPHGEFYIDPLTGPADLVFLAGGSGITPFASMIRETAARDLPLNIHLLYGSRTPEDVIFEAELRALAEAHSNIRVDFIISEPPEGWSGRRGFLDADTIASCLGSTRDRAFFICGPAQMHVLCEKALEALGVPGRLIRKEACGPPDDISLDPDWPGLSPETEFEIVEERSGLAFRARAGEPLMNSLERAGLVVPAVCRSGECAACRTRLISGRVFIPRGVRRRWSDRKAGYIHPCMCYPLEDLRLRL